MVAKSVKLQVLGDAASALRALDSVSVKLRDVTGKASQVSIGLKDGDLTKDKIDAIAVKIKELTDKGATVRVALEGGSTAKEELDSLIASSDELAASGARVRTSIKETGDEAESTGSKFKNMFGMAASTIGFIGLGIGLKDAISEAGNFQAGLVRLVSGAGEAQKNLGMVGTGIKSIAIATGTSTTQLLSGMYMIESAGFHGAEGLDVLKAASEGARAEGASLADVSNAVSSALNSYHLPASKAVAVTDELVTTVGRGKMTMEDLATSISTVLPVASKAGLSLAQVGGAIATMTMQGMSANQATQDLRHTIVSLQNPSSIQVGEMEQLGLSANDVAKNLGSRGLTGTIQLLEQTVLQHMGPAGTVLFNAFKVSTDAGKDLTIMLDHMSPSVRKLADAYMTGKLSMSAFRKEIPTTDMGMISQFTTLYNKVHGFNSQLQAGTPAAQTFTAAMSKIMGGQTGLATALMVGGKNMSEFTANTEAVGAAGKKAGSNVQDWGLIQETFNVKLARFKEVLQVSAITLGSALLPVLSRALGLFLAIPGPVWLTVAAIGGVVGLYFGVIKMGAAIRAFGVICDEALMTNPWLLLAVAIAVVAVLIITHLKDIEHWADVCFRGMNDAASKVFNWLKQNWPLIVAILLGPITFAALEIYKHWQNITSWTSNLWRDVVGIFTHLGHDIEHIWDDAFSYLTNSFSRFTSMEVSGWNQFWGNVKNVTGDAVNWIGSKLSNFWNNLTGNARQAWTTMVSDISGAWQHIESAVANPVRWIANNIWNKFAGVVDAVTNFLSMGKPIPMLQLSSGGHLGGYGGGDILPALLEPGETVVSKEHSKALGPVFAAAGVPGYSTGGIIGGLGGLWGDVTHAASDVAGFAKNLVMGGVEAAAKPVLNGMLGALGGMPGGSSGYGKMIEGIPRAIIPHLLAWIGKEDVGSGGSIVSYAESFIGKVPYVWGGSTPQGWDCSGFTSYVYDHFGYHPPRTSETQWDWVKKTATPVPGGLAFFAGGDGTVSSPGHVGIVVGPNKMVDAYGTGLGTRFNTIQGSSGAVTGFGVPPSGFSTNAAGTTGGVMSPGQISALWTQMSGPAWAAGNMARIADAESGDDPSIIQKGQPPGRTGYGLYQITPTSGIWQGGAFGNLLNAANNTRAAISLFNASGGYGPWTSDPVGSSLVAGGLSYANGGMINEHVLGFGLKSGRPYQFGERGAEMVTPLRGASGASSSYARASGGNTYIIINANECLDPDSTAAAIHQKLRRYKTKKGGQPLGLA